MSAAPQLSEEELDARLGEAIEAYLAVLERGERCSVEAWAARYPDIADELRECLTAMTLIQRSSTGPSPRGDETAEEEASALPRVPGYSVIEKIGSGGMGAVYKALQRKTKRVVALKFQHGDIHASAPARRRFEREVELAAALDHPGIVRILESGLAGGRDYYAMELVEGVTVHQWNALWAGDARSQVADSKLWVEEVLKLFIPICEAVNYAHQRGVIHRDLKPGNIMVDPERRPRILDFGLARIADSTTNDLSAATQTGQLVGTLPYLSPEQAAGTGGPLDVRSDIYSLGVILYEMLAGRPPYETGGALVDALHNIAHVAPQRPSHVRRGLRPDLDAIVLKALEKSKENRYQTAAALAEDLRCYLRGEPVEANRTSRFYLLRKAYARHRTHIHVGAAALGLVLAASAIITSLYFQVRRERNQLDEQLHISTVHRGAAHLAAGHDWLAEQVLTGAYRNRRDARAHWSLLSYFVQNPLCGRFIRGGWVISAAFSRDGRYLVAGNLQGSLVVYDAQKAAPVDEIRAHSGGVRAVAFSPSGEWLVTGGSDGKLVFWSVDNWTQRREQLAHPGGVTCVSAVLTGQVLSAGADGRVIIWEPPWERPSMEIRSSDPILACDLSPSSERLASANARAEVVIYDARSRREISRLGPLAGPVETLRFDPAGQSIAVGNGGRISLWDLSSGIEMWAARVGLPEPRPTDLWDFAPGSAPTHVTAHTCWTPCSAFSDDGALLACGNWEGTLRVWQAGTGEALCDLRSHGTAIYAVAFEPRTHRIAAGCVGSLNFWDLDHHPGLSRWRMPEGTLRTCVTVSSDGRKLAWGGAPDGEVCANLGSEEAARDGSRIQRGSGERWRSNHGAMTALAMDRPGKWLASAHEDGSVLLRTLDRTAVEQAWPSGTKRLLALAFSPDASLLAGGGEDGRLVVWRSGDGSVHQSWPAHAGQILTVAFAPDGKHVATGGRDWLMRCWEIGKDAPVIEWRHDEWVNAVAFSPDGRQIVTSGADLGLRIGALTGSPRVLVTMAHAHWVNALVFLENGRVMASGGNDESLRFWDAEGGDLLATLPCAGGAVHSLAASSDGKRVLVGAARAVQLIDLGAAAEFLNRQNPSR
jgi:serine/threonine protein kinase/WD40 repeat protein